MSRLFWLVDIALMMLTPSIDWKGVLVQAEKHRAGASLGLATVLASKLFLVPIPAALGERKGLMLKGEQLAEYCISMLLNNNPSSVSNDKNSSENLRAGLDLQSKLYPYRYRKLQEWLYYLFPPGMNDWESLKLTDELKPLYRLRRPVRLMSKRIAGK